MKVKELIEKLEKYDPETLVGNTGHFGEYLEVQDVYETSTISERRFTNLPKGTRVVAILIEDAGEEPE